MGRNNQDYVDLHVHTQFSDGSLSPAEAVEQAAEAGVGLLALTDHEGFDAYREALPLCNARGIRLIEAAELECAHEGRQFHLLCYGARPDQALRAQAAHGRALLDRMSDELIERLSESDTRVSPSDYARFERTPALGGWKALEYLMRRGVTDSLRGGMPLYDLHGVTYERAGFVPFAQLVKTIRGAGGRAVLAHPGHTLRGQGEGESMARVRTLVAFGLDGVECYHPLHSPSLCKRLADWCRAEGLMITAGSDCHGAFGRTRLNQMNIRMGQIDLRGL
ncbi:MAG: PHP domain-containing protein [Christensenellaceae bacterium]|nr:PHP domain-containing protein [Christensenellaceae bacterium]